MVCDSVCVCVLCVCPPEVPSPAAANGPINMRCEVLLSMYITYNSVSIPTPWAVAGPHGQLTSSKCPDSQICFTVQMLLACFLQ